MEQTPTVNLADRISAWGARTPDKLAIDFYGERWTYAALVREIDRWAGVFRAHGIGAGHTVLVFTPQSPLGIAVFFGVIRCGAAPAFLPLPSAKQEPGYYWLSHTDLVGLIQPAALVAAAADLAQMSDAGLASQVPQLLASDASYDAAPWQGPSPGAADDLALLQHSSGTTALKKGVQLTHRAIHDQVEAYTRSLDATADDVVVSWLPMYHDMGLIACTVTPLAMGQTLILMDPFRWVSEPVSLLNAIAVHRGTLSWLPNFAFELLARTTRLKPGELDLGSMRAFINCSEPCKAATLDRFAARFAAVGVRPEQLQVCYAMAETVFAVSQTPVGTPVSRIDVDGTVLSTERRVVPPVTPERALTLLSAGRLIDGMQARVVDEHGHDVPEGHVGEIELRSSYLFTGYLKRPEITAERLREGAYLTRDLGFRIGDALHVLGRADDLIIVHGRNYFAHEIESIANHIDGLKPGRNVAVDVFNELMGSLEAVLIAEHTLPDPASREEATALKRCIKHEISQQLGLELRDVKLVDAGWLVKTSSGKISRALNRSKYIGEATPARPSH